MTANCRGAPVGELMICGEGGLLRSAPVQLLGRPTLEALVGSTASALIPRKRFGRPTFISMEAATIINLTGNPFGEKLAVKPERVAELLDLSLSQVYKMALPGGVFEAVAVSEGKRAGKRILVASVLRFLAGDTPSIAGPSVGERADQARRRQRASASMV